MALLRPADHCEIYEAAQKYIALHDAIQPHRRIQDDNREDLHYLADRLRQKIEDNIKDADRD